MPDYLHECLDRHGQVTFALYEQRQKLQEVEQRAAYTKRLAHWTGG